jgi:pyrroloquinoline quinone biosynthesis protein B
MIRMLMASRLYKSFGMKKFFTLGILMLLWITDGCRSKPSSSLVLNQDNIPDKFLMVLGIVQDAGYPQLGCELECCKAYWEGNESKKYITCLALVDRTAKQYWLFEATPDITAQLHTLQPYITNSPDYNPDGIFITHAHIGHYTGLLQFGREAMNAKDIPVFTMPRMDSFLRNNEPWRQLITLNNIRLTGLKADSTIMLNQSFSVTPVRVPHRDEFSETVGFIIKSNKKKILFIPDIDKWNKWDKNILYEVSKVDYSFIDGTFYKNGELKDRDLSEVPHPFVEESMQLFSSLADSVKSKIAFIHFNHTNPLLKNESPEKQNVKSAGFAVAEEGQLIEL